MRCSRSEVGQRQPEGGKEEGHQPENGSEPLGSGPSRSVGSSTPVKLVRAASTDDPHAVVGAVAALPAPGIQHPIRLADVDLPALSEFKPSDWSSATITACHRRGVT